MNLTLICKNVLRCLSFENVGGYASNQLSKHRSILGLSARGREYETKETAGIALDVGSIERLNELQVKLSELVGTDLVQDPSPDLGNWTFP